MWRDFVSEPDGTVLIDGVEQHPTDGGSAYSAAIASFAREARKLEAPVLVRSTGQDGQNWFTVAPSGAVAVTEPPAMVASPASATPEPTSVRQSAAPPAAALALPIPSVQVAPADVAVSGAARTGEEPLGSHRKPSAADFGANIGAPAPHPAQQGWRGTLNMFGMKLAPGENELQERQWRAAVQRGLPGHKTVVFVNLKGGATKTTATFMVGATLGRVRGGNLLAWDNNENQGTLGDLTLPASHDLTASDLLTNLDRFVVPSNSPELMNYVRPQGENRFHALVSQNKASNQEVIDGSAFVQLYEMLRQFYHLILVDTGNAATASTWQASVEIADEIVLVALNKRDSTKKLAATVDTLIARGLESKLARGVLLLTEPVATGRKGSESELDSARNRQEAVEHFSHYVREIVHVPYDKALAQGTQVVFENLAPATQRAYLAATAAIVTGL